MICSNIILTYKELNEKANQLAHHLQSEHNIGPNSLVALCLDRNEFMIISILAVLKAGGAYVPIDPNYPDDRIKYILTDSNAPIVLTNEFYKERLNNISEVKIFALNNEENQKLLRHYSCENLEVQPQASDLSYVIYTSGTTGIPKGVMIEHQSFTTTLNCISELYFGDKDTISTYSMTNYTFDIFGMEYGLPLLSGGILELGQNDITKIDCTNFDFIQMTPSLCYLQLDSLENTLGSKLFVGGESLNGDLLERILDKPLELINVYGPTETTIWSTSKHYHSKEVNQERINNIGKAFNEEKAYVLDQQMQESPEGELYISGAGLARGYLNNPELTTEKFIEHKEFGRIYRTGDRVRHLANGDLEYIDRVDFQVKINGYRIECGEIESILNANNNIERSIVIAKEQHSRKHLVAYYIKNNEEHPEISNNSLEHWNHVFEQEYENGFTKDLAQIKQDFHIWRSSYTGKPIAQQEMQEWLDNTVTRIKNLNPKNVLELGSGNGLLLFNILDQCNFYYASDFSKNAIEYTDEALKKFKLDNKVQTFCCDALSFPYEQLTQKPDTVILNSVIQYFPNLDYFELVLDKLISNVADSGTIFIGDVRDYRLLKCFHHSVQAYKGNKYTKTEIDHLASADKELLISPEYSISLLR